MCGGNSKLYDSSWMSENTAGHSRRLTCVCILVHDLKEFIGSLQIGKWRFKSGK